jgi:hypothetical protein
LVRSLAAVANTIGVSSTTVASRLRTAVVPAAARNTIASSRAGRPREPSAIPAPSASNIPARRQPSASTSSAARKPTVGPSWRSAARASALLRIPTATSTTAPPAATAQSGAHRGRATAAARHAASTASATTSLICRRPYHARPYDPGKARAALRGWTVRTDSTSISEPLGPRD